MAGTLFVVATPIGNLEDITARALRVLGEVSIIAAEDTRRTAHLLARYAIATPTASLHEHNENAKTPALVDRLLRGESVALVADAGTTTVSDPGQRLIAAAIEAGIRIEPIPGPSAALAALSASGFPSDTFHFLGFPPIRSKDRNNWFEHLAMFQGTIVFYEAPHRIHSTLERLRAIVGDCPVCIARELTKVHEELVRGPISEVLARLPEPRGEYTVVVDVGHLPEHGRLEPPTDQQLNSMLGELTDNGQFTRREAVKALARRFGLSSRDVYSAIERGRNSVT
jgi:16S rRNA (cytidine1402-2'-O)-methyltransferase